jgi:hypothetical protein
VPAQSIFLRAGGFSSETSTRSNLVARLPSHGHRYRPCADEARLLPSLQEPEIGL